MNKSNGTAGANTMATCFFCGSEFNDEIRRGPKNKLCLNCRFISCVGCGKQFITYYERLKRGAKVRYCSVLCRNNDRGPVDRECEWCGSHFKVQRSRVELGRGRFCSQKCRGLSTRTIGLIPCPICDKSFRPEAKGKGRPRSKYCSRYCYQIGQGYENGLEWATPNDHTIRNCEECDVEFVQSEGSRRVGYCSSRCLKRRRDRMHSATRRLRIRRTLVEYELDPVAVCERDGWRCQSCGVKTPKRYRGTKRANAPEMDHIIPLSRGGTHTWDNVQCLCLTCNRAKWMTAEGQLRLAIEV